jgi:hypothetical protein
MVLTSSCSGITPIPKSLTRYLLNVLTASGCTTALPGWQHRRGGLACSRSIKSFRVGLDDRLLVPLRFDDGGFGSSMTRLDSIRDGCGASTPTPVASDVETEMEASSEASIDENVDK